MPLNGQRVMIVGGSSGIGLATARAAARAGADVLIAGRDAGRLAKAREQILAGTDQRNAGPSRICGEISTKVLDMTDQAQVEQVLREVGQLNHLVITASAVQVGPFRELPIETAKASMDSKFWGPYRVVRAADIAQTGSIVLVSGALSRRPKPGLVMLGAINAAVEALGKGLALELAPIRVNVVSPGLTDTPLYDAMPKEQRDAFFATAGKGLPAGRIGRPEDIAAAILLLLTDTFMTGTVLDVDGGGLLI